MIGGDRRLIGWIGVLGQWDYENKTEKLMVAIVGGGAHLNSEAK